MASDVLATDTLGLGDVTRVRTEIEQANARRLQPHYIRSFFSRALTDLGGRLAPNRDGTYRIRRVPLSLAVRSDNGVRRPLPESYESLAFDKGDIADPGRTDLVCVGHPLLDAAVDETLSKHEPALAVGTVLMLRLVDQAWKDVFLPVMATSSMARWQVEVYEMPVDIRTRGPCFVDFTFSCRLFGSTISK